MWSLPGKHAVVRDVRVHKVRRGWVVSNQPEATFRLHRWRWFHRGVYWSTRRLVRISATVIPPGVGKCRCDMALSYLGLLGEQGLNFLAGQSKLVVINASSLQSANLKRSQAPADCPHPATRE
jgi:hypothetical protein